MAQPEKITVALPQFVEDPDGNFVPRSHPRYSALLDNEAACALTAWLDAYGGHLLERGAGAAVEQIERNAKVIVNLAATPPDAAPTPG